MKKLFTLITAILLQWQCFAQAPNISYPSGAKTYAVGKSIATLTPTNTGGSDKPTTIPTT